MNNSLSRIYEDHHKLNREAGFSIMKDNRGSLFAGLVGQGKKVLDIGCRDGALTSFFVEGNKVFGVDIDRFSLNKAKESFGIDGCQMDLQDSWMELSGRLFDVVVAGEVLEHVYYPDLVSKKVSDHLVTNGLFIGSVPNAFNLKNRLRYLFGFKKGTPLSDPTHINHFHVKELRDMLSKHFSFVEIIGLGRWNKLAKFLPGWCAFDLVFVARK